MSSVFFKKHTFPSGWNKHAVPPHVGYTGALPTTFLVLLPWSPSYTCTGQMQRFTRNPVHSVLCSACLQDRSPKSPCLSCMMPRSWVLSPLLASGENISSLSLFFLFFPFCEKTLEWVKASSTQVSGTLRDKSCLLPSPL